LVFKLLQALLFLAEFYSRRELWAEAENCVSLLPDQADAFRKRLLRLFVVTERNQGWALESIFFFIIMS
jgi:hypothetical protein